MHRTPTPDSAHSMAARGPAHGPGAALTDRLPRKRHRDGGSLSLSHSGVTTAGLRRELGTANRDRDRESGTLADAGVPSKPGHRDWQPEGPLGFSDLNGKERPKSVESPCLSRLLPVCARALCESTAGDAARYPVSVRLGAAVRNI